VAKIRYTVENHGLCYMRVGDAEYFDAALWDNAASLIDLSRSTTDVEMDFLCGGGLLHNTWTPVGMVGVCYLLGVVEENAYDLCRALIAFAKVLPAHTDRYKRILGILAEVATTMEGRMLRDNEAQLDGAEVVDMADVVDVHDDLAP
jgi:hypothetical protein